MIAFACEFEVYEPRHVRCIHCKRALTGTPEDYNRRLVCANRGPGFELFKKIELWANRFRIKVKHCGSCNDLRLLMNKHGRDWCRENREGIASIVMANAKSQGLPVPSLLIKVFLKSVES